jgi:hypothetical protein
VPMGPPPCPCLGLVTRKQVKERFSVSQSRSLHKSALRLNWPDLADVQWLRQFHVNGNAECHFGRTVLPWIATDPAIPAALPKPARAAG